MLAATSPQMISRSQVGPVPVKVSRPLQQRFLIQEPCIPRVGRKLPGKFLFRAAGSRTASLRAKGQGQQHPHCRAFPFLAPTTVRPDLCRRDLPVSRFQCLPFLSLHPALIVRRIWSLYRDQTTEGLQRSPPDGSLLPIQVLGPMYGCLQCLRLSGQRALLPMQPGLTRATEYPTLAHLC